MKVYGIKNCNSVKKALDALNQKGIDFEFLDIKKLDESILNIWLKQKSFQELINTTGTTAKKLGLNNELKSLILDNPSCIKRPVIMFKNRLYIGKEYEAFL